MKHKHRVPSLFCCLNLICRFRIIGNIDNNESSNGFLSSQRIRMNESINNLVFLKQKINLQILQRN